MTELISSPHFDLEQLARGVFAAVATPEGAARSNAGIVDLGDQTLILDAFDMPSAAADLRAAAEALTGLPATLLIITHQHGDHWRGASEFAGTPILSTAAARERMVPAAAELEALRLDPSELEQVRRELQEKLHNTDSEAARFALRRQLGRVEGTLEALPDLRPTLPTMTFRGRVTFHGSSRRAELVTPGYARTPYAAHTPGDCYLLLPDERIILSGDLAFFSRQPYMGNADPGGWRDALREVLAMPYDTVMPGHGPVGGRAELEQVREYLVWIEGWVKEGIAAGRDVEDLLAEPLPEQFIWPGADALPSEVNVRALYRRFAG